jgi:RNA recognition motif-containing protein
MIIYIGNLSLNITEDILKSIFQPFGEIQSVTIMNDKYIGSGQPKGYGFVEMSSRSAGENAIARLKDTLIGERRIVVVEALALEKKTSQPPLRRSQPRRRIFPDSAVKKVN